MPATYNLVQRQADTNSPETQSLLQHLYFIAAAAIVLALVTLRIVLLRRRNQSLSDFFRLGPSSQHSYGSYPPYNSNHGSMYHGIQLASPPAAYHPDRRVRAADVDIYGRRLGASGTESRGKDALPPYDNFDRPPKYIEAYGGPPPLTEQPAVTSSPGGGEGGTTHPDTTGVAGGNADDDTHNVAGVTHETDPPPARHDLSSS